MQEKLENITPWSGEHELSGFDRSITSDRTDSVQGTPVVTSNFAKNIQFHEPENEMN